MPLKPDVTCRYCRGTGIVTDWVDYGSTRVSLDGECGCAVDDDAPYKITGDSALSVWYMPDNTPLPYCVYKHGFMIAEEETEAAALANYARASNFTREG